MSLGALFMNTSTRQGLQPRDATQATLKQSSTGSENRVTTETSKSCDMSQGARKTRVRAEGNHALHELLMSMLTNHAGLEMLAGDANEIFRVGRILENSPDVLLLMSRGNLDSHISNIRKVRMAAPEVRIVMFGGTGAEREFLQYVRAGIRCYLLMGAGAKDVWEALEAVHAGKAS